MFYEDHVTGERRVKRRYVWGIAGFTLGVAVTTALFAIF
ncbi:MAG: hypothetical protein JWQ90_1782 [Hydrocarboniphaga sp.]|nr:hypothetical protein [Hydrocarboniphaga sp.]